ncbi:MAG: carboxypeptidase-like regulatory domain-containing protein, partial [Planctomycetota bacterium]
SPEVPRSEITVDLSGIVRDSNGNPAPGARVVLLSDTMRYLSQLSRVVPERNELAFLRENLALNEQTTDAIAATYSDDQGRFELKNVQPPEVIRDVIDPFRWAATLLAISNQHELGILNVRSQDRGTVVKNNLYIDLTRTHDLAGRLVDQDGNGLGDKEISVNYFTSLTRSASDYRILTGVNQFVLHYRLWPP